MYQIVQLSDIKHRLLFIKSYYRQTTSVPLAGPWAELALGISNIVVPYCFKSKLKKTFYRKKKTSCGKIDKNKIVIQYVNNNFNAFKTMHTTKSFKNPDLKNSYSLIIRKLALLTQIWMVKKLCYFEISWFKSTRKVILLKIYKYILYSYNWYNPNVMSPKI